MSIRTPGPPASMSDSTSPVCGEKLSFGSSALILNSIAWLAAEVDRVLPRAQQLAAATRICSAMMSTPVSISVTGCSTWMRQLISMK